MMHDEVAFPDPFEFKPERHMGQVSNDSVDPFHFVFGFGRRICAGAHWAQVQMFINMASILSVFDIECPVDQDGATIMPAENWTTGTTSQVCPHPIISWLLMIFWV
jgi:cytochrome P450